MMNRIILSSLAIMALGCAKNTAPAPTVEEPAAAVQPASSDAAAAEAKPHQMHPEASIGKPQAPVEMTLDVNGPKAVVSVMISAESEDVTVTIKGIDGLTLDGGPAKRVIASAAARHEVALPVALLGDAPRGTLVVTIEGRFDGVQRGAVKSFVVGGPKVMEDSGAVETGLGPVMPAGE